MDTAPRLPRGRGTASAVDRVLSYTDRLRRSPPALFHAASTLSGSLRSPPSPRGEGFVSEIAVDRGLSLTTHLRRSYSLSFIPLEPYPARFARHLPHAGKALSIVIVFPHMCVFVLTMREKRYSRFAAFPMQGKRCYPCAIIHKQHCPYEGKPKRRREHPAPL